MQSKHQHCVWYFLKMVTKSCQLRTSKVKKNIASVLKYLFHVNGLNSFWYITRWYVKVEILAHLFRLIENEAITAKRAKFIGHLLIRANDVLSLNVNTIISFLKTLVEIACD